MAPDGTVVKEHFGGALFALSDWGIDTTRTIYTGLIALIINLLVAAVVTALLRAGNVPYGADATREEDYHAEAGDPEVEPVPVSAGQAEEEGRRF